MDDRLNCARGEVVRAGSLLLVAGALFGGCAEEEPEGCPSAIDAAEETYTECVEEIGLEIETLRINAAGDIDVLFGESFTPALAEQARRECEEPMQEALVVGLLACESITPGQPATAAALEQQLLQAEREGFSGSALVVRDGQILLSQGVGLADRERGLPNTPQTAFGCGSIMKDVTAAAIFQLEAEGLLSRADPLQSMFEAVPSDKAAITIEQLLTHRSGLLEFHDTMGDFEPMTRPEALDRIFAQALRFEPGQEIAYSNSGYTLLAAIVEEASGLPYAQYIHDRIFAIAGMSSSGLFGEEIWAEGQTAIGYEARTHGCNSPSCWPAPSWALIGNGGLVSTTEDLLRFIEAVDEAIIFESEVRDAYRRDYLGLSGAWIDGERIHGYAGQGDFGFGAAVAEVPGRSTYVIVAANAAGSYNNTVLVAQLLQMTVGAFLELDPPE